MKATTIWMPGALLACGILINCSDKSGAPTPVTGTPGATGVSGAADTAGMSATIGGSGAAAGGAGTSGGSAAGGSGAIATGKAPGPDGKCVVGAFKHMDDMLCYCQPTSLTYCSDGCFDPQVDADHCGACATNCGATQVCNAAKCSAALTTLVPAAAGCGALHLALNGTTLYWTDTMHGSVQSLTLGAAAAAKAISTTQKAPTLIIASAGSVFWLTKDTKNAIMRSVAGAAPTVVYTADGAINGFTVSSDGNTVYFATGTKISKVAATGGTTTEVGHEDSGIPHALSVDEAAHLIGYPTDENGDVDIMTMVDGTPAVCASDDSATAVNKNCVRVARSQGSLNFDAMLLTGGKAYWSNQAQVLTAGASDTTGVNSTVASGSAAASKLPAVSFGAGTVFFADDSGLIAKAPLMASAAVTELARAQPGTTSVVGDASHAYWATGDCAIKSVALTP